MKNIFKNFIGKIFLGTLFLSSFAFADTYTVKQCNKYFNGSEYTQKCSNIGNIDITKVDEFYINAVNYFNNNDYKTNNYNLYKIERSFPLDIETTVKTLEKSANNNLNGISGKVDIQKNYNKNKAETGVFIGNINPNLGIGGGYSVKQIFEKQNTTGTISYEMERINWRDFYNSQLNEYCLNPVNKSKTFLFIYDTEQFFMKYSTIIGTAGAKDTGNTGALKIACSSVNKNTDYFGALRHDYTGTGVDNGKSWSNADEENNPYLFTNNGYIINMPLGIQTTIPFKMSSFFSTYMEKNNIEYGGITSNLILDMKTEDWSEGKCGNIKHLKKSLINSTETYTLNAIQDILPMEEYSVGSKSFTVPVSAVGLINSLPNSNKEIFAVTPDSHLKTHALSKDNEIIEGRTNIMVNYHVNDYGCKGGKGFNIFIFVLAIAICAFIAPYAIPAIVGTTAASAITYYAVTTVISVIISLYDTNSGGGGSVNSAASIQQVTKNLENVVLNSGSQKIMNFVNMKNVINKLNKDSAITPKIYTQLLNSSNNLTSGLVKYSIINESNNVISGYASYRTMANTIMAQNAIGVENTYFDNNGGNLIGADKINSDEQGFELTNPNSVLSNSLNYTPPSLTGLNTLTFNKTENKNYLITNFTTDKEEDTVKNSIPLSVNPTNAANRIWDHVAYNSGIISYNAYKDRTINNILYLKVPDQFDLYENRINLKKMSKSIIGDTL